MAFLIDTSVLARLANNADALYPVADAAITKFNQSHFATLAKGVAGLSIVDPATI